MDDDEGNESDICYEHEDIMFDHPKNTKAQQQKYPHEFEDRIVRTLEKSGDFKILVVIEDFWENFYANAFLSWLYSVEHFFEWKGLHEDMKFRFVTI